MTWRAVDSKSVSVKESSFFPMSTLEDEPSHFTSPSSATPDNRSIQRPPERRKSGLAKTVVFLLLAGCAAGAIYAYTVGQAAVQRDFDRVASYVSGHHQSAAETAEPAPVARPNEIKPTTPWDGFVRVAEDDAKTMGLLVVTVQPQVAPISLELQGRTDYDPNTLSKIRPRFDTLVEKVYAELGQKVKRGDPLVDLFSTELASAKNDFQTAFVQWRHDVTLRAPARRSLQEQQVHC